MNLDDTVRGVIYKYRVKHDNIDPPMLQVTPRVYRDLKGEYLNTRNNATPATWYGSKLEKIYGVPIVVTERATRFDKNGCYAAGIDLYNPEGGNE